MPYQKRPLAPAAAIALMISIIAVGLAILGVYSPWGALRVPVEQKLAGSAAIFGYGGTCVLPILLGFGATLLGGYSFKRIEQSNGKYAGDGPAFFSLMIGLFAAIIGSCTTFATLIWPMI